MALTWGEFKALVDKSVEDDKEIFHIDAHYPSDKNLTIVLGERDVSIKTRGMEQ